MMAPFLRAAPRALTALLALVVAAGPTSAAAGDADQTSNAPAGAIEAPGRWSAARWSREWGHTTQEQWDDLTEEQKREFERLGSLAYVAGSEPAPDVAGVTVYDSLRACEGLSFYTSGHFPGAVLTDMRGNVLHEWRCGFSTAWPDRPGQATAIGAGYWRRAHLFENGDVLAVFEGLGLIKVDKHSRLLWKHLGGEHHDFEVQPDGRIFVLTREPRIVPRLSPRYPVLEDFITILDEEGGVLGEVSLLEALEGSELAERLLFGRRRGDILHTNTVEVLDGRLSERIPAFRSGNVLVCIRQLDAVAVVDLDSERVVWALSSPWKRQHQATVLESGNILLFDNQGNDGASRIIEFDAVTEEILWEYAGEEPSDFYSRSCGSNQRLPNGNTLITESDYGRAFEVTHDGDIVWEFFNPAQIGNGRRLIATLFEALRIPHDHADSWLEAR